ncbi:MAG: hypothetical protein KAI47_18990 [Deltaproteobacteria bacterium]|nr:hypothetical protein [Deltaproteobacteria bacterium]
MIFLTWALAVLGVLGTACGNRRVGGDGSGGDGGFVDLRRDLHDGARDSLAKRYPWVSTYLGAGGCGDEVSGDRRTIRISDRGAYRMIHDRAGRLYLISISRILVVDHDVVTSLVDQGTNSSSWDRTPMPISVDKAVFGGIAAFAAVSPDRIYLADEQGIAMIDAGWLRWLAGSKAGLRGHIDGVGEEALFWVIGAMTLTSKDELIVADAHHLRKVVRGEVTTLAGSQSIRPTDSPKDGDALTEATLAKASRVLALPNRILFYDGGLLRELRGGRVSTLAGEFIGNTNLDPQIVKDGLLKQARIRWPSNMVVFDGAIYFLDHNSHSAFRGHWRRRIRDGRVETVGTLHIGAYRDGPLDEARFEPTPSFLAVVGDHLLVNNAWGCRVREIELR